MLFIKSSVFGLAALAASALAQETTVLQFTSFFNSVNVGITQTLKYTGGDGSPITIILKKGPSSDLKDVATITTSGSGKTFDWTPKSVPEDNDYALSIQQSGKENFSNQFTILGGSSSSSSSSSSKSASSTKSSSGSKATASALKNSTITTPIGTAASGGFSTTIHRNSTLHSATLTRSTTATETATATETDSSASATDAAASATPTNGAASMAGSMSLIFSAVLAVLYFN
ncbi:MAG: hypothetical protein M1825_002360 [Sarcosagium campestre]|nr:MAG: hypothetical protein M1825_002360 [Sarcosagium campestre]